MDGTHTYRIELVYEGVSLDDDVVFDAASSAQNIVWSAHDGVAYAHATQAAPDAIVAAGMVLARITALLKTCAPRARALRLDRDLVSTTDVAERSGVSREAVRLWSEGARGPGGFPMPVGVVGNRIKVWEWGQVNSWLRHHYRLGEEVEYPTQSEATAIDAMCLTTSWTFTRIDSATVMPSTIVAQSDHSEPAWRFADRRANRQFALAA